MNGTSSFKEKLVLDIIEEHFGNITKRVANVIMTTEDCTLVSIARYFSVNPKDRISISQIRDALSILLHHRCLIAEINPLLDEEVEISSSERMAQPGLIYSIDEEMVLNRLHFPIVRQIAYRLYEDIGSAIIDEIIVNGRLQLKDIVRTVQENDSEIKYSHDDIVNVYKKMVSRRLLIPVFDLDVSRRARSKENKVSAILTSIGNQRAGPSTANTKPTPVKRKRAIAKPQEESENASELPLELRMMLQAEKAVSIQDDTEMKEDEPDAKVSRISIATTIVPSAGRGSGRGRGRGRAVISSASTSTRTETVAVPEPLISIPVPHLVNDAQSEKLWTLGWDQIVREERHTLCVSITHSRMDKIAGEIIRIMLESSMNSEAGPTENFSAAMTINDIHEKLRSSTSISGQTFKAIDITVLRKLIDLLRSDALGILVKTTGNDPENGISYQVNMESLITFAKRKAIHDISISRYDVFSGRIIELLQRKKYLEQQELADMVILPARDVREKLYRMYKDKWVDFYEFSKRNDFNPSSTFYFWFLDHKRLNDGILSNMYKTAYNLRLRKANEAGKQSSDPAYLAAVMQNVSQNNTQDCIVSPIIDRLEISTVKLTKTIFLLSKF